MRTQSICLALAIILHSPFAAGQWVKQNSGTTTNLYGVSFVDAYTGTVVGDSGTILRTTNGGAKWVKQVSGTTNILLAVTFTDANIGVAVGGASGMSQILGTTDGGTTWISKVEGRGSGYNGVSFTDANTGTVVGGKGVILRTTDGGTTWFSVNTDSMKTLKSVYFSSLDTGLAVGYTEPATHKGIILRTTNGGTSWDTTRTYVGDVLGKRLPNLETTGLESIESCLALGQRQLACIRFTDSQTGCIVGWDSNFGVEGGGAQGIILTTRNGGVKWSSKTYLLDAIFASCHFVDSSTGWVVGAVAPNMYPDTDTAAIWHTSNGGNTWSRQFSNGPLALADIHFTDQLNGWAVGGGGIILHTANGGVTFVDQELRNGVPSDFSLLQNYPNPFNPSTTIKFELPKSSVVTLSVFDVLGREVSVLVHERRNAGVHEVRLDGSNLASGVYFYRLTAGDFIQSKRLLLLR
jgi:photosystem II stability/assembly factor-like uncharacterized protein